LNADTSTDVPVPRFIGPEQPVEVKADVQPTTLHDIQDLV
jgi:hypothetical protein